MSILRVGKMNSNARLKPRAKRVGLKGDVGQGPLLNYVEMPKACGHCLQPIFITFDFYEPTYFIPFYQIVHQEYRSNTSYQKYYRTDITPEAIDSTKTNQ